MALAAECTIDPLGFLVFALLIALPVAILATWITIALYRRAVSRAMQKAGAKSAENPSNQKTSAVQSELTIELAGNIALENALSRRSSAAIRRLALLYTFAGCVHAACVTALQFWFDDIEFLPVRTIAVWLIYAWPVVPAYALIAIGQRRAKAILVVAYFVSLVLLDFLLSTAGTIEGGFGQLILLWLLQMGMPTLILLLLGNRAWRCVGLIAFLLALALTLSWIGSFQVMGCVVLTTRSTVLLDWMLPIRVAFTAGVFALAWWGLRLVVRRYEAKRMSDQSLMLDSWWLLFTIIEMTSLAPGMKEFTPTVFAAFVIYKAIVNLLLPRARADEGKSLLLLRVFGHAKRSERLLDELGQRWRTIGPINLIAEPGLASAYLTPDELAKFWTGKLDETFVTDESNLRSRLATLDNKADRDGRYRVNDFFCHADTWQVTVDALAARASVVLMDLRGFTTANLGCRFELGLLLERVPLSKVRLLVDETTDMDTLQPLLTGLWRSRGRNDVRDPRIHLLHAEKRSLNLARELFAAAA